MEPKQIYSDESSSRYHSFIAENLKPYNQCEINELWERRIRACFHGWVILSNHPDNIVWSLWNPLTSSKLIHLPPWTSTETSNSYGCFLWNLFTSKLIHLLQYLTSKESNSYWCSLWNLFTTKLIHLLHLTPKINNNSYECCLSSPPDEQGSIFMLLPFGIPTIVFCRLDDNRKRSCKWIEMSYAKQLQSISGQDDCYLECPTCYNGKVYAITLYPYDPCVIQVDIEVKGNKVVISLLKFLELPSTGSLLTHFPSSNSFSIMRDCLQGSCTQLFYIKAGLVDNKMIGDLYLFKLDMTNEKWEEMEDLKDTIFFLEYDSDHRLCPLLYKSAVPSEIGGYIHILDETKNIIHSFHVKDRTVSLSSKPYITRQSQLLMWAMLECGLEVDFRESKHGEHDKYIKRDEAEFDSTGSESQLLNIPFHMLETIMEHCVGVEYMNFRATSKYCHLAAPVIHWRNKTTSRRLQTYSVASPWLVVLDNLRDIITFIDPIYGDKYFIKVPSEFKTPREDLADCQIFCSGYGWLLLFCKHHQLVFFNPFTGNILNLPKMRYCFDSVCFSAQPTFPDCMVVGFRRKGTRHVYIHFVSRKPPSWRKYSLDFGTDDPYTFHLPAFSGHDVYALCKNQGVAIFRDIGKRYYSWEVVKFKAHTTCCGDSTEYFLSKYDEHLLLVIVGEFGKPVMVFKLNESTREWEKIDDLGKHVIYISNTSCICLEAGSPQMENKIYFSRFLHNEYTKIVFYSLETCMYHTFDDKSIQESFGANYFKTKDPRYPTTWIEPSWA